MGDDKEMNGEEMSELPPEEDEAEGQSFAELLRSYGEKVNTDVRVGDRVRAEVISIGRDTVFLDIGAKIDAVAEKQELLDTSGNLPFDVGDVIELYVISNEEAEIRLSRAVSGVGGEHMLQEAYDSRIPVEGKVSGPCKGGVNVEIFKRRAFCPISQLDLTFVEDPAAHVGQTYEFLITRLEGGGKNIVVSRRKLLAEAQEKARRAFFETLEADAVLDGRVTRIMPYGAFVELAPGVEGMVHVSELSWSRVASPQDVVTEGDPLRVKVLAVEDGAKNGQKKISLSVKQVGGDPWETAADRFAAGQRVLGTVTRCAPFGAFVEIAPGIEGMAHISELSFTRRVTRPEEVVQPGEAVSVLIKEIDVIKRRISLSLREAQGDPWIEVSEKFGVGRTVAGTVEKKERFGIFVALAPGITGLLPASRINQAPDPSALERLRPGDPITVSVTDIDLPGRRITLAAGGGGDVDDWRQYSGKSAGGGLGSLGEQLQRALSKRKE